MKKSPRAKAKEKAWKAFSLYIRTRDQVCCTCGGAVQQAGHFIDGRHNAVLFSERGVHGQCYHCNVGLKGNKLQYWLFMEKTYGRAVIDELMAESRQTVQFKPFQFDEIAEKYQRKTEKLLEDTENFIHRAPPEG
jgi:hypothetical protein